MFSPGLNPHEDHDIQFCSPQEKKGRATKTTVRLSVTIEHALKVSPAKESTLQPDEPYFYYNVALF